MSIRHSLGTGAGRVVSSPALVCWVYLALFLLALPLTAELWSTLDQSFGSSLVQEKLRNGFDLNWYEEFAFNNPEESITFGPSTVGILPVLTNYDTFIEGKLFRAQPGILLVGIVFLLVWAFLAGGILDRLCRPLKTHSRSRLFSQGAEYFFRMVRLIAISGILYYAIFRLIGEPLLNWLPEATRDITTERTVLIYRLCISGLVMLLLLVASLVLDYAKISLVFEERRSSLLATIRGFRFVLAHPGKTSGLYGILLLSALILLGLYSLVAPGPGQSTTTTVFMAFLLGQAYLIGRICIKLWFWAAQAVLFQTSLSAGNRSVPFKSSMPPGGDEPSGTTLPAAAGEEPSAPTDHRRLAEKGEI